MDGQKPLWRTAWYWKQVGLYLIPPLIVLFFILMALTWAHHLAQHTSHVLFTLASALYAAVFGAWINYRPEKMKQLTESTRNE